jgi:hypothetical protein
VKRCTDCGRELRLAHGMWSHVEKGSCKIQFIRATESERAAESPVEPPPRRRAWGEDGAPRTPSRFGYLAARSEPAGPGP